MNKNKKKRAKSIEIKSSFTGGTLTNYSGIKTLHKFMNKLGLISDINSLSVNVHHNTKYETGTMT